MIRFVPIIVLLFVLNSSAQDPRRPFLIDEFGNIGCDDFVARFDFFDFFLRNAPTNKGVVVISGSNEDLTEKLILEIRLTSRAIQRGYGSSGIRVVHGDETGLPRMQFWIYPNELSPPEPSSWNMTLPKNAKPSYFFSDEDGICVYPTVYRILADLLASNKELRLNVVLSETSALRFRQHAEIIRKRLPSFERKRLRFFRDKAGATLSADFWIVP